MVSDHSLELVSSFDKSNSTAFVAEAILPAAFIFGANLKTRSVMVRSTFLFANSSIVAIPILGLSLTLFNP